MRTFISILVFFCLWSSTVFATSIVAVKNADEIVIGADSKTTATSVENGADKQGNVSKCKIVQAGSLFFASAGSAGIGSAERPYAVDREFDLREVVAEGLRGEGGIEVRVRDMERVLVASLTRMAEKVRRDNPAFFLEKFVKSPVYTVIVGGLDEKGELVLMVRTFRFITSTADALSVAVGRFSCPGDCQVPFITIFEGRTGAIKNYLEEHELFLHFADPVTAVRDLVELEISKDPSSVGPPVDVLRMTKRGAEWVQRKVLCPDIQLTPSLRQNERSGG
jgi:hypothetical protein